MRNLLQDPRLPDHRGLRHPAGAHRLGDARRSPTAGHPAPTVYTRGPRDFERLCETEELDLVYNATPWEWHVPDHAGRDEERQAHGDRSAGGDDRSTTAGRSSSRPRSTQKHCVLMENCNYDRMEMMVYNMVRQGLFGEILHAEGGYLHDLRGIKFDDEGRGPVAARVGDEARTAISYPTHGLGPIANCLDINRGDRFDYLVSMSGPSRGLQDWAAEHFPADAPKRQEQLRPRRRQHEPDQDGATARRSWSQHCTNLPRPHSRIHIVQGTKGLFAGLSEPRATSKGAARADQWVDARDAARRVRASAVEGNRRSRPRAPATAAWTSSRTTA